MIVKIVIIDKHPVWGDDETVVTKKEIHQCYVDQISEELAFLSDAAKKSLDSATNDEHQAKSKYETFSLESSYLARGQAKRVAELTDALDRFQILPLKDLNDNSPIQLSALIRLERSDGERRVLFLGPAAGGEKITSDGEAIVVVTSLSPMGKAVLGRTVGDTFNLKMGPDTHTFTVMSVE